jgi:ribosomal protein S18 acetylase RimI-like enzyme
MTDIRPYRADDLAALYEICLKTGDSGKDATALYDDPKLIGHVYAAPYGVLAPECCFVVEDAEAVGGYIIGARDTYAFEKQMEREWWPALRGQYPDPKDVPPGRHTRDQHMAHLIHHPDRTPRKISEPYPSHLHINLLPRLQGIGWGKRLVDHWLEAMHRMGSPGACLGVGLSNQRAVKFYRAYGFEEIAREGNPVDVLILGIKLSSHPSTSSG